MAIRPSTLPTPQVDWAKIGAEHGKPDQRVIEQHERDLANLDNTDATRGGRRGE